MKEQILNSFINILSNEALATNIIDKIAIDIKTSREEVFLHFSTVNSIIEYYFDTLNLQTTNIYNQSNYEGGTTAKITFVLNTQFSIIAKDNNFCKGLIKYLTNPSNAIFCILICKKQSDNAWKTIEDKSSDFNFHTKRIILSGIYASIFTYLKANQNSINLAKLQKFIDLSVEKVVQFGKAKGKLQNKIKQLPIVRLFL